MAAHQAPPSMGFSRQEYWSGVPSPSPPCLPRGPQNTITPSILKYWGHAQYPQNNEGGKRSTGRGSDFPKVTQKVKGTVQLRDWIFEFLPPFPRRSGALRTPTVSLQRASRRGRAAGGGAPRGADPRSVRWGYETAGSATPRRR